MAVSQNSKILASDISGAIKSITRSGTTFTYTTVSGGTGTFTQQDNNTTYSAGTGLSLSSNKFSISNSGVTAGSYGPSANATPAYGATFNVPYVTVDATGRVTAASTKTVKIPAKPSGGSAESISNVAGYGWKINSLQGSYNITNATGTSGKLPSGGTWFCYVVGGASGAGNVFTKAGGSSVSGVVLDNGENYDYGSLLAIRIS